MDAIAASAAFAYERLLSAAEPILQHGTPAEAGVQRMVAFSKNIFHHPFQISKLSTTFSHLSHLNIPLTDRLTISYFMKD